MHADPVKCRLKGSLDLSLQVVGIENRVFCGLRDTVLTQSQDIGHSFYHNQEIACEGFYLNVAVSVHHGGPGQILGQMLLAANGTAAGTAAAMAHIRRLILL